jgi:glycosyltransferase involved in cell wall biosynthesis
MNPPISVIMSVYAEPMPWIKASINSILSQTFRDFEFIIINDNPSNAIIERSLQYYQKRDERIILIKNEINLGLTKSLNKAIKLSRGKYVVRMDADDISVKRRLKMQYEYMEANPNIGVSGSWAYFFGEHIFLKNRKKKMPVTCEESMILALFSTPLIHPSTIIRRTVFEKTSYDETIVRGQDYALWGTLIHSGIRLCNIPDTLIKYRVVNKATAYTNAQDTTANGVRLLLIDQFMPDVTRMQIDLHNQICSNYAMITYQICDVEKWLLKLRSALMNQYPAEVMYIRAVVSNVWVSTCIKQKALAECAKSDLFVSFSKLQRFQILRDYIYASIHYEN